MKLVAPDELSAKDRAVFEEYKHVLPEAAVCVNVMLTGEQWDLRPLALHRGRVWMYRFSKEWDPPKLRLLLDEIEGFTVIPYWETSVRGVPTTNRFVMIRPFVQSTLKDVIFRGELNSESDRLKVALKMIEQVRSLLRRNLVHGHVSLSNMSLVGDELILLDPRLALLQGTKDEFVAPEAHQSAEPDHSVDLYGLGRCLAAVMGTTLSAAQRSVVDQLLLPSPRQRPALDHVEAAFSFQQGQGSSVSSATYSAPRPLKVLNTPSGANADSGLSALSRKPLLSPTARQLVVPALLAAGVLGLLRYQLPSIYFSLARYLPLPASRHNAEYESDWASGDKLRMRRVARAAVIDHDPAAQNAIIESIMGGAQTPGIPGGLLRAGLNPLWSESLSRTDQERLVALTVAPLVPEGIKDLPPLDQLNAPTVLAVACQMPPSNPSKQLDSVPLTTLEDLPKPVGPAFRYLRETGIQSLSAPEALGLASIACGQANAASLDAYFGRDSDIKTTIARVANAFTLLGTEEEPAAQMLASLRDNGGEFGAVLSWFFIDDLAKWSAVPSIDKLALALDQLPARDFSLSQYTDLLSFPLPGVRKQAVEVLSTRFFKPEDKPLLSLIGGDQGGLTRQQTLALVSALSLPADKRTPFVAAWFETKPSADAVLLIMLARSHVDSTDQFNLEGARYLRKQEWRSSLEILQLMARHPEPLLRSMAYSKLDPSKKEERTILQDSLSKEKDASLHRSIEIRLGAGGL